MIGETVSHYKILVKLGEGGMGVVYKALDTKLDRHVAIKFLSHHLHSSPEAKSRFVQEAKAASALEHPNICAVHEIGETPESQMYMVMPSYDGQSLQDRINDGPLSIDDALECVGQIASGLAKAHTQGIVHRDVKPGNIFLTADGHVKILDFGLAKFAGQAKITKTGTTVGTVSYMSPEQARGDEIDTSSDVFSLGVVLYQLLTKHVPFSAEHEAAIIYKIMNVDPEPLSAYRDDLGDELQRVIDKALAKDREARYRHASELLADLKRLQGGEKVAEVPRPPMGIGVMPIVADTDDSDLHALARGLTEDLVTGFSNFSYLSVVHVGHAGGEDAPKGNRRDTARRLGVRYFLGGSLRRSGTKVRLSARVTDAMNGSTVWSERFDRDLGDLDLFEFQDQLTDRIVATVADSAGVLVRDMAAQLRSRPLEELTGTDWMLRTFGFWEHMRPHEHAQIRDGLEQAVKRKPDDSAMWACLAQTYLDEHRVGFNVRPGAIDRALAAARRAVELDPRNSLAEESLADVHFFRRDMVAFRLAADRALSLNPRDTTTQASMGMWLVLAGELERGFEITGRAIELNPHHPGWYQFAPFFYHYDRGEYRQAFDAGKKMNMPDFFWNWLMIAAASGQLGLDAEAGAAVAKLRELLDDAGPDTLREADKMIAPRDLRRHFLDGVRKAGLEIPYPEDETSDASRPDESAVGVARTRSHLVGRDREHAELLRNLENAAKGHGGLVLLGGEPGVGKTCLARQILDDARDHGMLAIAGHAREQEEAPFVMVTELLEDLVRQVPIHDLQPHLEGIASELTRLLPELHQLLPSVPEPIDAPPEQQRRLLFRSVLELLTRVSREKPMVVLLDDIHWADASSLQLIEHIAPRLAELPILGVGTYRDVEADMNDAFLSSLSTLTRQRLAERVPVKPFTESSAAKLLAELAGSEPAEGMVKAIYRHTEGNAFFIEELFRHLSEVGALFDEQGRWRSGFDADRYVVPEGVRLVIGQRLERLSESTRETLTTAAVLGLRFELRILRAALADTVPVIEALEEAAAAHLIHAVADARSGDHEFSHELVRRTLLGALSAPRVQRLHLAAAEAIEGVLGDRAREFAPQIAMHLLGAGGYVDPAKTVRYLIAAGDHSLEEAAADEALRYYNAAAKQVEESAPTDDGMRARIRLKRATAQRARGEWPAAMADFEEALELFDALGDRQQVSRVCCELGDVLFFANRVIDAAALSERGLAVLPEEHSVARCRLLSRLGCYLTLMDDFDRGDPLLDEAEAMADSLADPEIRAAVARFRLAQQHRLMNGTKKLQAAIDAVELAKKAGSTWELSQSGGLALVAVVYAGRFDLLNRIDDTERLAEQLGDASALMCVQVARTFDHLFHGRVADAVEQGEPMLASMERLGGYVHHGHAHWATAYYYAGDWQKAREHSAIAAEDEPRDGWYGWCAAAHVKLLAHLGERKSALEIIDAHASDVPEVGSSAPIGCWTWALAAPEAFAVFGMLEPAATYYPLLVDVIGRGTTWVYNFGLVEKLAGIAAAAGRRWEQAERHFATALRQARDFPCRVEEPEVLRWQAWAARRRGRKSDRVRARALLTKALDTARDLRMDRHVELLQSMLDESD